MIPDGAHPRVKGPWFGTGIVYGLLVIPWLGPFMLVVGGIFAFVEGSAVVGFLLFGAFFLLLVIYLGWLWWYVGALQRSFMFDLGKDTLTIRRGVLWRKTSRIPLRRVQDVVAKEGPFLRMAGLGTVHVQTAGLHAAGGFGGQAEGIMPGLEDPQLVAEEILAKVKKLKGDV